MGKLFKRVSLIVMSFAILISAGLFNVKADEKVTLTVSAAASLQDVLNQIKPIYLKKNPDLAINFNYGSSGALEQQIEQGAPADLFISAAQKQMDMLTKKSMLTENTVKNLVTNNLVLVAPKNSTLKFTSFLNLLSKKIQKIGIGEPKTVPAGQYALESFQNYKIKDRIASKEVFGKDVREVLSWVQSGNVDCGVVYETDAMVASKDVKILFRAPAKSHSPIIYPIGVIKGSKYQTEAAKFENYLLTDKTAKSLLKKYGFGIN